MQGRPIALWQNGNYCRLSDLFEETVSSVATEQPRRFCCNAFDSAEMSIVLLFHFYANGKKFH